MYSVKHYADSQHHAFGQKLYNKSSIMQPVNSMHMAKIKQPVNTTQPSSYRHCSCQSFAITVQIWCKHKSPVDPVLLQRALCRVFSLVMETASNAFCLDETWCTKATSVSVHVACQFQKSGCAFYELHITHPASPARSARRRCHT